MSFLATLVKFLELQGKTINRAPRLEGYAIDLYRLYKVRQLQCISTSHGSGCGEPRRLPSRDRGAAVEGRAARGCQHACTSPHYYHPVGLSDAVQIGLEAAGTAAVPGLRERYSRYLLAYEYFDCGTAPPEPAPTTPRKETPAPHATPEAGACIADHVVMLCSGR